MKVRDVMTTRVISVRSTDSILHAVRLMLQNRISGLPVLNENEELVGIVTEGDLLRRTETGTEKKRSRWLEVFLGPGRLAEEYVHSHARTVGDVMTPDPYTVSEDTALEETVTLMERDGIKRVPVTRENRVVGIVSRANLLHALARMAPTAPKVKPQDSTIRQKLISELEHQKWAPTALINIVVQDGMVDLWGSITDEREREALVVAAQNIPGVKGVRDHLVWTEPMTGVALGPGGALLR